MDRDRDESNFAESLTMWESLDILRVSRNGADQRNRKEWIDHNKGSPSRVSDALDRAQQKNEGVMRVLDTFACCMFPSSV